MVEEQSPAKRGRKPAAAFTPEDDAAIARWVSEHPDSQPQSKALWEDAVRAGVTKHPASTMQSRWRTYLKSASFSELDRLAARAISGVSAAESMSEAQAAPSKPASRAPRVPKPKKVPRSAPVAPSATTSQSNSLEENDAVSAASEPKLSSSEDLLEKFMPRSGSRPSEGERQSVPQRPPAPAVSRDTRGAVVAHPPSADAATLGRLSRMVAATAQQGLTMLQLPAKCDDTRKVPVLNSMTIEAKGGLASPTVIRCPGMVISGAQTKVILKNLTFEAILDRGNLLEVVDGASVELENCRLMRGTVEIRKGASASLESCTVIESPGVGINATDFHELNLIHCRVMRCLNDGVRLTRGKSCRIEDCTVSNNGQSGVLVDSTAKSWPVSGCTFSGNAQYGIWADAGATLLWGPNSVAQNMLGEKSGKGELQGWTAGISFNAGDDCCAWIEDECKWLVGRVSKISTQAATASVKVPKKRLKCKSFAEVAAASSPFRRLHSKTSEGDTVAVEEPVAEPEAEAVASCDSGYEWVQVTVQPRAIQQAYSGFRGTPSWSDKRPVNAAYELFLHEGGCGHHSWEVQPAGARKDFEERARKVRAKESRAEKSTAAAASGSKKRTFAKAMSGGLFTALTRKRPKRR